MIEKKKLIQQMTAEEDKITVSRLYDLARSARGGWRASGFFLDPAKCARVADWFGDCEPTLWGGYEGAERRMVSFGQACAQPDWFPICAMEIVPSLAWEASHRDILGAVMGLGIDRSKIGDILVTSEKGTLFCDQPLSDFLSDQLCAVGRYRVKTREIPVDQVEIPDKKYQEITDTVASLRADCILAAIYSLPRAKAQEAIISGRVTVNWEELTSLNAELKEGDVISLRGMGRSELTKIGGLSRKGRIFIQAKRLL